MYQSYRAQLLNAQKEAAADKYIGNEINQMIRNQMLMQGITPITIEKEKPSIEEERDYIMSRLKTITTQPIKFYDYLYRTNQIEIFSIGMEEFARKHLKYRKNIPANTLINIWEKYKIDSNAKIENLSEIEKSYNKRNNIFNFMEPNKRIPQMEKLGRFDIESNEAIDRDKIESNRFEDYERLQKPIKKQAPKPPPPPPMPKKLKTPESNLPPLSPIDKLMDELKEKIKLRKIEGIGIKKRKNRVNVINNKVIYPIGYRYDWQ